MHALFLHSDVPLAALAEALPHVRLFTPCAIDAPEIPPFIVRVESPDEFSITQAALINLSNQGAQITALPHPRDKSPLTDAQIAKLQKHTPKVKKGDCMNDLLGYVHAVCPSTGFDPSLHCF